MFDFVIYKRYVKNSSTNESYIPLTAHWLIKKFVFKHRVLHCHEIKGEDTGQNICNYIRDMFSNRNITLDRNHVFFCEKMQDI